MDNECRRVFFSSNSFYFRDYQHSVNNSTSSHTYTLILDSNASQIDKKSWEISVALIEESGSLAASGGGLFLLQTVHSKPHSIPRPL